ncbi:hypothetical protein M9434_004288 [Picochlorum sp. BPE23]|nr:hypothetical protein M9434_004288 [Picochlorum sp. BPE23]
MPSFQEIWKQTSPILFSILAAGVLMHLWKEEWQGKDVTSRPGMNCCGPSCRIETSVTSYYDQKYFDWQKKLGEEKAPHSRKWGHSMGILPRDKVAEFGSGSGFVIENIEADEKWAVELNPHARTFMEAEHKTLKQIVQYAEHLPNDYFDFIFSGSVIEHVECPVQELREIYKKLRCGGKILIGVKNEGGLERRHPGGATPGDIHNHLWTWNEMLIANTIAAAGFFVEDTIVNRSRPDDLGCFYMWQKGRKDC